MGPGSTEEWRVFQEHVADHFRRIPGCRVTVGERFEGARVNVEVDVVARLCCYGLFFTILIECKCWKTRVPQKELLALKAIVDDVGANLGILVSKVGHQKGKREYLDSSINVQALTLAELEALKLTEALTLAEVEALKLKEALILKEISGPREMHVGVCSDCGRQVTYPFGLTQGKNLSCSNCYRSRSLADYVGFDLIASDLGNAVESALQVALSGGAVFANGHDALVIFRQTLAASIRNIESHPRGRLFQEFLLKGPYEDIGEIPAELVGQRFSDADTAAAITFIYSHMVNCFKGEITELLAAKPCMELMRRLQQDSELPRNARLYVGDSVGIHRARGKGLLKGADLHILIEEHRPDAATSIAVAGVMEVKSYIQSKSRLREQLDQHLRRAKQGLRVSGVDYPAEKINVGYGKDRRVVRIAVVPSNWKLPRSFRFEESESGRLLHVDAGEPPLKNDEIIQTGDNEWCITLKWSKEALAEAAFEMTFWYMEKIGEVIYSKSVPKGWEEMTQAEAGRNATKMMLYYAILRCRTMREEQRAIALYNSYGYGYSPGMNYKNAEGRREMLWPQDLDEILSAGKTKSGCILR